MAKTDVPSFLRWSESTITFDRSDHPKSVPQLGRYPLLADSIISTKQLTKVLMDGGSGLNIIIAFEELTVIKEGTAEEAPDSKRSTGSFEPAEGVKEVLIDPSSSEDKVVHIGTTLSSKIGKRAS